jgi:type I restriction enzyme S subunit
VSDADNVRRLKYAIEGCINGVWGDEPNGIDDIIVVRVADFDRARGAVTLGDSPTIRAIPDSARNRRTLRSGDLLIEKSGGGEQQPVGNVVLFNDERKAVCSNFVARMAVAEECDSRFVAYSFHSLYAEGRNIPHIKQTSGIQNLDSESYFNERAWLPEKAQQVRIANFLDEQTARIDTLIAEKERLAVCVREFEQGKISELVTYGVRVEALRKTGNAFVPAAPCTWRVAAFKRALVDMDQGWSPQCESRPADSSEWGVLKVGCVNGVRFDATENKALPSELAPDLSCLIRKGDVLVSRANTRELVGLAAMVDSDYPNLLLCDKLYRLKLRPDWVLPAFSILLLRSGSVRRQVELGASGASSSMQNISQDVIRELVVALPPLEEQQQIVILAERIRQSCGGLRAHVAQHISRLREYRSSLISAAVTGQLNLDDHTHTRREVA